MHRIGRTGRAGSSGAAISLVDFEEAKYLKDIEKLIKREIPKVAVEGFAAPTKLDAEPPRAPRPPQGRRPQGNSQNKPQGQRPNLAKPQAQRPPGNKPAHHSGNRGR